MKFYIATRLENHAEHNRIRDALQANGDTITYDWTLRGSVKECSLDRLREVSLAEAKGVIEADYMVLLWPGGCGAHVELGIAIGAWVPTIFLTAAEGHYEAVAATSAFYHHPLVWMVRTEEELYKLVKEMHVIREHVKKGLGRQWQDSININ